MSAFFAYLVADDEAPAPSQGLRVRARRFVVSALLRLAAWQARAAGDELVIVSAPPDDMPEPPPFAPPPPDDSTAGPCDCPRCGQAGQYRNVGRDHWGLCAACRVRWYIGSNLFSSWRDETPADWERHERELADYRMVGSDGFDEVPF